MQIGASPTGNLIVRDIHWTWETPDDGGSAITGYDIRWRLSGGSFTTVSVDSAYYRLANRTPGSYEAQARAVNSIGSGSYSGTSTAVVVSASAGFPSAPDTPVGEEGNNEIRWAFKPNSDGESEIIDAEIQVRDSGGNWPSSGDTITEFAFTDTGATNGTQRQARVSVRNARGSSGFSGTGTATPAAEVPDQIQHIGLSNTSNAVEATWGEPENNGSAILDYRIQWDDNSGFSSPSSATITVTNRTITGTSDGSTLYVRVRARNAIGNGTWSPTEQITRDDGISVPGRPPSTPVGAVQGLSILWSWDSAVDNGARITGYDFQWRVSGSGWSGNIVSVSATCYALTGLIASTTYEARVRARNVDGVGSWTTTPGSASTPSTGSIYIRTTVGNNTFVWPWEAAQGRVSLISGAGTALGVPRPNRSIRYSGSGVQGAATDGTTMWFADTNTNMALAYILATGAEDTTRNINLGSGSWGGATSDGTTLWFINTTADLATAYTAATQARDISRDIDLSAGGSLTAASNDGTTLWVVDDVSDMALAYILATGAEDTTRNINLGSGSWRGATSDGTTLWFINNTTDLATAYTAATQARDTSRDFSVSNAFTTGLTYAEGLIWIVDRDLLTAIAVSAGGEAGPTTVGGIGTVLPPAVGGHGVMFGTISRTVGQSVSVTVGQGAIGLDDGRVEIVPLY